MNVFPKLSGSINQYFRTPERIAADAVLVWAEFAGFLEVKNFDSPISSLASNTLERLLHAL
jgi:hypothetical protein